MDGNVKRAKNWGIALVGVLGVLLASSSWAAQPVAGASFTTVNETVDGTGHCQNGNPNVNCNIYDGKTFVWLTGGPGTAALSDGTYMFAVLAPGGQGGNANPNDCTPLNLSDLCITTGTGAGDDWSNRVFSISGGAITYLGTHNFANNKIRLMPYDDTTNPGGVYILAICQLPASPDSSIENPPGVVPSLCKYDAFKVTGEVTPEPPTGDITIAKYCDLNGNGSPDGGLEVALAGWLMKVDGGATCQGTTDATGVFTCSDVSTGNHLVSEADVPGWTHTGTCVDNTCTATSANSVFVDVTEGETTDVDFGNVKYVACGGRTMGFWSNPNGQAKLTATALCGLTALNLVKADGSAFDPVPATGTTSCANNNLTSTQVSNGKTALKNWLLSATATNMAYMLSAQMAAAYLDLQLLSGAQNAFQIGTLAHTCPAVDALVNGTIISISALITEANGELAALGGNLTVAAGAARTCEEEKKNIFDAYNKAGEAGTPSCNSCAL